MSSFLSRLVRLESLIGRKALLKLLFSENAMEGKRVWEKYSFRVLRCKKREGCRWKWRTNSDSELIVCDLISYTTYGIR